MGSYTMDVDDGMLMCEDLFLFFSCKAYVGGFR